MNLLRKILFPFSAIYAAVTWLRNFLYDKDIFKSYSAPIPVIAVGNLSVGGTGKTPQIEYLIRLLSDDYKIATLSRGYKRKSTGFILADANSNAETLGDEPYQFYTKFPNIRVAVDSNRKNGILKLLSLANPDVILLDDAFQHRKVKAGFYILLTAYGDLYCDDFVLPTGNMRESRRGAKRGNIIVVTKCPQGLSTEGQLQIQLRLRPKAHQEVYFSFINYDESVYSQSNNREVTSIKATPKVLLAGIAKPQPFFDHLRSDNDIILKYPDHHHFSAEEIVEIKKVADGKMIITTEKDFVRLKNSFSADQLYYLPIKSDFIGGAENFVKTIKNYVGKSTTNS